MPLTPYQRNVFINCPFDDAFRSMLEAMVFAVHDCGFVARSALEADDGSQVRITKIYRIVAECGFGDRDRYRYQSFCSDIAGQDVRAHAADPEVAIKIVRNWLRNATTGSGTRMPGPATIQQRYRTFRNDLPLMCTELQLDEDDLIFNDYTTLIASWLQTNEW